MTDKKRTHSPDLESFEPKEQIELKDILDYKAIQSLMDDFYSLTHFGIGVIDLKGNILVGTGWQDICINFHRANLLTVKNCIESDLYFSQNIKRGEYVEYHCKNNLRDIVTPIFVSNQHVGNLFLGQFLYDDEVPELKIFEEQAEIYHFDKNEYLSALSRVPRWDREKVKTVMSFYSKLAQIISNLLTSNLALKQTIEEKKSVIDQLKVASDRYKLISDNTGDVIWILDLNKGKFTYVSPSVEKLRGYSPEEVMQMDFSESVTTESLAFIKDKLPIRISEFENGNGSARIVTTEVDQKCKDGSIVPTEVVTTLITDESEKVVEILGVTRNISERKKADEIRDKLINELNRSNKELEQFAYVASHDLQEPLRMISTYTKHLEIELKDALNDRTVKYMEIIIEAAKRMHYLIHDLLSLSRISNAKDPFVVTDLNKVIEDIQQDQYFAIAESKTEFHVEALPLLKVDPFQIKLLFQNLISNAIKFKGKNAPVICIDAYHSDNTWTFKFKDNGIGIDPEYFDKIFIIFQRLHERGQYAGTGIGLSICKKIIENHGGRIWVESEIGKGTTFYFTIPDIQ
ncbi:MAG: PocR ligand-binding domain-containing protein [Bacteroidota bacterium]|nr:PocR ligand-binding domain-containing protein [Bacteroidota bacterium]MDP4196460.1 PocR ligand-binding domain-containing protein [Bacteroidota bacterium]